MNSSASSEHHRGPYGDYSSPSSNRDDSNERRSRASSVSSAHNNNTHQPNFQPSPRLDVAQSFENMTVRSPIGARTHYHRCSTPSRSPRRPRAYLCLMGTRSHRRLTHRMVMAVWAGPSCTSNPLPLLLVALTLPSVFLPFRVGWSHSYKVIISSPKNVIQNI